jgi:hypothetical protein
MDEGWQRDVSAVRGRKGGAILVEGVLIVRSQCQLVGRDDH